MKILPSVCVLTLIFLSASIGAVGAKKVPGMPAGVDIYSAVNAGNGLTCLVGAKLDEDGMNERPVVFLRGPNGNFAWSKPLEIPAATYQGRATHCVASPTALFILVQSDTEPQQSITQTLLQLYKLDKKSGRRISEKDVVVPGVSAAYTAWVDEAPANLTLKGDKVVVTGKYNLIANRGTPAEGAQLSFSLELSQDLNSPMATTNPNE